MEEVTVNCGDVQVTAYPNGRRPLLVITHEGQLVDRLKLDPDDLREREKAAEMLEVRLPGRRWLTILRDVAQALAEATQASQGETFPQTNMYAVEGKVLDAATILSSPTTESLESLPLLGQQGVVIKGWSHLLVAPPKCGKTELVWACVQEWDAQGLRVLWVTEETESVWAERLRRDNASPTHVRWLMAAGMRGEDILAAIREAAPSFDVVAVDTLRHLFQADEGDNAAIARTISALDEAIGRDKTRIYLHHTRKAPGQHGERTAGGFAFVGGVDRQLELSWDEHDENRRLLKGVSRICPVPEVLLGWEDGRLKVLGHPRAVELAQVKERVLGVLDWEWRTTAQVIDSLGEPRPSDQQVRAALKSLAQEGLVERQPPIDEGDRPGCRYLWRLAPDLSSNGEDISLREGPGPQAQGAPAHPADPLAQAQEETHPLRQPEDPPPLPAGIRHICPRCGGEVEMLKTKAQCLSCLLIFTPPRIPKWALEVLWEEAAQGEFPDTGRLSEQDFPNSDFPNRDFPNRDFPNTEFPNTEFPNREFPNRARVSEHDFPNKGRVSERPERVSEQAPGVSEQARGVSEQPARLSEHLEGVSERHCPGCGRGLPLASMGRPRRWCSDACRMRLKRQAPRRAAGARS